MLKYFVSSSFFRNTISVCKLFWKKDKCNKLYQQIAVKEHFLVMRKKVVVELTATAFIVRNTYVILLARVLCTNLNINQSKFLSQYMNTKNVVHNYYKYIYTSTYKYIYIIFLGVYTIHNTIHIRKCTYCTTQLRIHFHVQTQVQVRLQIHMHNLNCICRTLPCNY